MNRNLPAIENVFLGLLTLSLGISAIAISQGNWKPDNVCVGIWGGIYVLLFGVLLKIRKVATTTTSIMGMALFAVAIGLTVIGIHSWSINGYQADIKDCDNLGPILQLIYDEVFSVPLCNRVAVDALLLVSGILIVLLNALIAAKASALAE